jgi:hypothetical protein
MAYIDVLSADVKSGRLQALTICFKNASPRTIDRETALGWLREGHSMLPVHGHGHDVHRGAALERVEVDGVDFIRTDTRAVAADDVSFAPPK